MVLTPEILEGYRRVCVLLPTVWQKVITAEAEMPPCLVALTGKIENPCSLEQNFACHRQIVQHRPPKPKLKPAPKAIQAKPERFLAPWEEEESKMKACGKCKGSGIKLTRKDGIKGFDSCPACAGRGRV